MREEQKVFVLLFSGSGLDETLSDVITDVARSLNVSERGKLWQIFPGTGAGGNFAQRVIGLVHGQIGKNTCYDAANAAITWLLDRQKITAGSRKVITVSYSRGFSAAHLTAHYAEQNESLAQIKFIHLDIDPVPGPFGNHHMVPPIASNVEAHINLLANHSMPFPLSWILMPDVPRYRSEETKRGNFLLPTDHAGAGGVNVRPFNAEQSALTGKGAEHFRAPILALTMIALKKMGVVIASEIDEETVMQMWIQWAHRPEKMWQPNLFNGKNHARRHDRNVELFACLSVIVAATAYALFSPSTANFLMLFAVYMMMHKIMTTKILMPVTTLAKPLLAEKQDDKKEQYVRGCLTELFALCVEKSETGHNAMLRM